MAKQKYRADQIGSFLRPQEIRDAHTANVKGDLSTEELRKIEDAHISRLLEMQKQTGIDVYSDGEWRRGGWAGGFAEAMAKVPHAIALGHGVDETSSRAEWHISPYGSFKSRSAGSTVGTAPSTDRRRRWSVCG